MIGLALTVLVITDLTAGTARFNLGSVAALGAIAASISTGATGFLFQTFGPRIWYLPFAVIAAAATFVVWRFLSETKPERYGN